MVGQQTRQVQHLTFFPSLPLFRHPKTGTSHYEERLKRSVVGEFNRVQQEMGKSGCSNGSSHNWLKLHRPKVAICPHQEDYCDTCARRKAEINATTINRMLQSGVADPAEVKRIDDEMQALRQSLEVHRQEAEGAHKYYNTVTAKCMEDWEKIQQPESSACLNDDEKEQLAALKNKFNLVLCADFQMAKLVPYWGLSPQLGSTYYLQKLSHDVFGIVNHATNSSAIYLFDKQVGPKCTDHTVSYISDYLSKLPHHWIKRVHIFLDNTSNTNKNYFLMGWAHEMVSQGISFLIAGHTKFSPDLLFSKIAQSNNRSDIFSTEELKDVVSWYSDVVVDDGNNSL